MINLDLLTHYVEWVEAEAKLPEEEREWDQSDWGQVTECGTTYCIAGKIACDLGWHPTHHPDETLDFAWLSSNPEEAFSIFTNRAADDIAAKALGIHGLSAADLFDASNTAEDVRRIAEEIAGQSLVRQTATA